MANLRILLGILAVVLTFLGYIPYFADIMRGKTKPHLFSWLVWFIDAFIIFVLQIIGGAGPGAFVTLAAAIMCLSVLVLTLFKKAERDITFSDKFFLFLAFVALCLWLIAKQPVASVVLIMLVDIFGFIPTIRKSWNNPFSETPLFFGINVIRFAITLLALNKITFITALYPGVWLIGNSLFLSMLILRKKALKSKS